MKGRSKILAAAMSAMLVMPALSGCGASARIEMPEREELTEEEQKAILDTAGKADLSDSQTISVEGLTVTSGKLATTFSGAKSDCVWSCSMPANWNLLLDLFNAGQPVTLRGTDEKKKDKDVQALLDDLNTKAYPAEALPEGSFYMFCSDKSDEAKASIDAGMHGMFGVPYDSITDIDWATRDAKASRNLIMYNVLNKVFSFDVPMKAELGTFSGSKEEKNGVRFIARDSSGATDSAITPLLYDSPDRFAVRLQASGGEALYFARGFEGSLAEVWTAVSDLERQSAAGTLDIRPFSGTIDGFSFPYMSIDYTASSTDLTGLGFYATTVPPQTDENGNPIGDGEPMIVKDAYERVVFSFDYPQETADISAVEPEGDEPRYFNLSGPFCFFARMEGDGVQTVAESGRVPFLAASVTDISKFQRTI